MRKKRGNGIPQSNKSMQNKVGGMVGEKEKNKKANQKTLQLGVGSYLQISFSSAKKTL